MNDDSKKEIATTVVCTVILGIITVLTPLLTKPEPIREIVTRPDIDLDKIRFDEYFPLKKGNFWIYGVREILHVDDYEENFVPKHTIKVEVIDSHYHSNGISLFRMSGSVDDLYAIKNKAHPTQYTYLLVRNKLYKITDEFGGREVFEKAKGGKFIPLELPGMMPEYEFPLFLGQRIGGLNETFRPDYNYCKVVKNSIEVDADGKKERIYQITDSSLGTVIEYEFRPYHGFFGYHLRHRGSTHELDIKLITENLK